MRHPREVGIFYRIGHSPVVGQGLRALSWLLRTVVLFASLAAAAKYAGIRFTNAQYLLVFIGAGGTSVMCGPGPLQWVFGLCSRASPLHRLWFGGTVCEPIPSVAGDDRRRVSLRILAIFLWCCAILGCLCIDSVPPGLARSLTRVCGAAALCTSIVIANVFKHRVSRNMRKRFAHWVAAVEYRVCPSCHYCLSGLSDEGRCPECGGRYTAGGLIRYWRRTLGGRSADEASASEEGTGKA